MSQRRVKSAWRGGLCCDVEMGEFNFTVDEPESVGGTNLGPQPTDVFLASIASCFTLALSYSAQKRGIVLRNLQVDVTGTYDGPRFSSVLIEGKLGCDEAELPSLVRDAERVCYVTNTLKSGIDIKVDVSTTLSEFDKQ